MPIQIIDGLLFAQLYICMYMYENIRVPIISRSVTHNKQAQDLAEH